MSTIATFQQSEGVFRLLYAVKSVVDGSITYTVRSDVFTFGAGYLDVQAALMNTDLAPSTVGVAQSSAAVFDS
jgi:hypothetical protein